MPVSTQFDSLRIELSVEAKNGIDFTLAASVVWLLIAYVWMLPYPPYRKAVVTFIVGAPMLPLAFLFSRLLKTTWTIKTNPLQPLGLWLNFAQLFYFPILFFALSRQPEQFVMLYAIITGAHFFPYSWFFKTPFYAVGAGFISIGCFLLGSTLPATKLYLIPFFMSAVLLLLTGLLFLDYRKKGDALATAI